MSDVREPDGKEPRGGDDDADDGPDGQTDAARATGERVWRRRAHADAAAGDGWAVKTPWYIQREWHANEHDPEDALWPSVVVILVCALGVGWLWWR